MDGILYDTKNFAADIEDLAEQMFQKYTENPDDRKNWPTIEASEDKANLLV